MKIPSNMGPLFSKEEKMATKGNKQSRQRKKSASGAIKKISAGAPKARRVGPKERQAGKGQRLRGPTVPGWDRETDVLVVGFGAAGANAAIAAHDAGARVLIIEKMGVPGGNSGVCAGAMLIPESIEDAIRYYRALSFGTVDEKMIRAFAEAIVGIPRLLTELGAEFTVRRKDPPYFPSLLNAKVRRIQFSPTGVEGFHFLENLVRARGIEVRFHTRATALIQDPLTREVIGIKAEGKEKKITLKARRGVVLACGGYEYSQEILADFNFPGLTDFIFPWGTPGNTGDGIRMASEAGAALWHMASVEWGGLCARIPSKELGMAIGFGLGRAMPEGGFLFVNQYGKRFMQENKNLIHRKDPLEVLSFDHERAAYRNLPAYMVFDEAYRRKGPIASRLEHFQELWGGPVGYPVVHGIYDWSTDNRAEMQKGWVLQADTLDDLAMKIGVDAMGLGQTIRNFNRACGEGTDSEFGRARESLAPLAVPPFYAVELALTLVNTQGGPKHNEDGQVLDFRNEPIPRLYAAGELGSFFGFLYQGGSNYPEAWAFGQIAGKKAAAETTRGK
jgi:succinate dehydrogenase/fumarate reductase flavoprotein subunit